MSASVSSPLMGEKQEAAPVRHKGVNDLDKVVLREVRGSSTELPACHSRESPGMFQLPDHDVDACQRSLLDPGADACERSLFGFVN
jgi:hypothetical protein